MRLFLKAALFAVLLLPVGLRAQSVAEPLPADAGATATLSVTTRLVVVPAVVRDKHGALMNNLTRDNFVLKIDGKTQALRYFDHDADVPLTLGLLVDTSLSQRTILDDERAGSVAFLDKMLSPADAAFLMQFDINITLWQGVTAERPLLDAALKKVDSPHPVIPHTTYMESTPGGDDKTSRREQAQDRREQQQDDMEARRAAFRAVRGTKLFDAVVQSSTDITGKLTGRRALILLTDGGDFGSVHSLSDAIEAAQRADTVVYAIYYVADNFGPFGGLFAPGGGHHGRDILEHLCSETGGKVFEESSKLSVEQIYAKIAEELRGQYRLGFTPSATAVPGYHHVQLSLTGAEAKPKHVIQTRDGFYSSTSR